MSRPGRCLPILLACLAALASAACSTGHRSSGGSRAANLAQARELMAKGNKARSAGDLELAIDSYRAAAAANPDFGAAWNNLGSVLMLRAKEADLIAAQQALHRASDLLPTDPTPSRNLGRLYQSRDFAEDALKYYLQALAIAPYDRDSLRGATACVKSLRRADTATLDMLKRAKLSEIDPTWRSLMDHEYLRVENDLREKLERN